MNQKTVYANIYSDIGFDRKGLFELISKEYHSRKVLYPGCSLHITPSFVFPHVVYVDKSKEAKDFFIDDHTVRELITNNKTYKTSPHYRFLPCDFASGDLALEDMSFDLLISLYADNIIKFCKRYVRNKGILISNNFHDEALEAVTYKDLLLIGYIRKIKNKYILYQDPNVALEHRDETRMQRLCMKNKNGALWYEDHETYYVFQVNGKGEGKSRSL